MITQNRSLRLQLLVAAVLLLGACGIGSSDEGATDVGYEVVRRATIEPGDPIPAPAQGVVLTVDGAISNPNVDDRLELDIETLEAMGTVAYSVFDGQAEGRTVRFEGVLLDRLLSMAGATDEAETLMTVALNDYTVEIPASDATASPVLVATRVDGERMPIDRFGPIRIVYPYATHDLDPVVHDPRWIWQLSSIEVR